MAAEQTAHLQPRSAQAAFARSPHTRVSQAHAGPALWRAFSPSSSSIRAHAAWARPP